MDENDGPRLLGAPRPRGQEVGDDGPEVINLPGPAGPVARAGPRQVQIVDDSGESDLETGGG